MCPLPPTMVGTSGDIMETNISTKTKVRTGSESTESSTLTSSSSLEGLTIDELLAEKLGKGMELVSKDGDSKSGSANHDIFGYKVPAITLSSYLRRMLKYIDGSNGSASWTNLSSGSKALISAVLYIDRIVLKTDLVINSVRIHKLIATGMLVALKMNEDAQIDICFYSQLAGISVAEMKRLESAFLDRLSWDTVISDADFNARVEYFKKLCTSRKKRLGSTPIT